jgi:hypothetical protein
MFEYNGVGAIWCVIKHALLTHFHLLELYQKNYEPVYIEQAQQVYLMINDLLKTKYNNYSNCSRCDGDKEQHSKINDAAKRYLTETMGTSNDYTYIDTNKQGE